MIFLVDNTAVFESADPLNDLFPGEFRPLQPCLGDGRFQLVPSLFQGVQPFLGGAGQYAGLDGVDHVFDTLFTVPQLSLQCWDGGVLRFLYLKDRIGNAPNHIILQHLADRVVHHSSFNGMLSNGLASCTSLVPLGSAALVVVMDSPVSGPSALTHHKFAAVAAEQLAGEQVFLCCLASGRSPFVRFRSSLHPFKKIIVYDCRKSSGNDGVTISVLTDVRPVFHHLTKGRYPECLAPVGSEASAIERIYNVLHHLSIGVSLEYLSDNGYGQRINIQLTRLFVDVESKRCPTAVVFTLHSVFLLAAPDLYRQLGGIVFVHALQHGLQNDALRPVRDGLLGGDHLDAVLFENVLIMCAVVPIPRKAVQLPDKNRVKQMFLTIGNHPLEVRAVCSAGGQRSVNIAF